MERSDKLDGRSEPVSTPGPAAPVLEAVWAM